MCRMYEEKEERRKERKGDRERARESACARMIKYTCNKVYNSRLKRKIYYE